MNPTHDDPILAALRELSTARDLLDERIRVLLALARERTYPRPYRLKDLADAAGMSISGVRIAYDHTHIQAAQRLTQAATAVLTEVSR